MDDRVRRGLIGLAVVVGLWLLGAGLQVLRVADDARAARAALESAQDAVRVNDVPRALTQLRRAEDAFVAADRRLRGGLVLPLRGIPVAARHIRVGQHLVAAGTASARAGRVVAEHLAAQPGGLRALAPSGGALPLDVYSSLAAPLRHADALLARAVRDLHRTVDVPVSGRLDAARREALSRVPRAAEGVHRATALLPVLDELLGGETPRRYLFVAQNPAELRGTGGFIGAYSVLRIDQGRFSFGRFSQIQDLPTFPASEVMPPSAEFAARYNHHGGAGFWHNINMTPDFPTAARAMETLYARGTGQQLDGVIAVDPFALQALLAVAGPVDVPGFGTVGPDNVVDVVSNRAHAEIRDSEARKSLLGAVAIGAFTGFVRADGPRRPLQTAQTLIDVLRGRHLLLHSTDPPVQAALLRAGVAGALTRTAGDFAAVIANAGSAAKLDYYIERRVTYAVQLQPDGSAIARLEATFTNHAPTEGISARVIGPNARGLAAGEQRLILSLFAPANTAAQHSTSTSDAPVTVSRELDRTVFDTVLTIPSNDIQTVGVTWSRSGAWQREGDSGTYRLVLQGQTTIRPTAATVEVTLPPGTVVTSASPNWSTPTEGSVRYSGPLEGVLDLTVDFAPPAAEGFIDRVRRWWAAPIGERG